MSKPSNPPAFPVILPNNEAFSFADPGMTLRDWFASQTIAPMALMLTDSAKWSTMGGVERANWLAKASYAVADAMLAERERSQ